MITRKFHFVTNTQYRIVSSGWSELFVATFYLFIYLFFLIWGGTRSLRMPALRPASQAGPMCNPREGIELN